MNNEYDFHDIMGVDRRLSICVIAKMSIDEIKYLESIPHYEDEFGFDIDVNNWDEEFAENYNFNLQECLKDNDSVLFDFSFGQKDSELINFIESKYPKKFKHEKMTSIYCNVFYAPLHSDNEVISSRGQLMFILDNKMGHNLYSIDDNKQGHLIIPKKGDIILLDVKCYHSVFPNQENGLDAMKEGMKFVSINYK